MKGYAAVKGNRIKVGTVCEDRESADFLCEGALAAQGYTVRPVIVTLAAKVKRKSSVSPPVRHGQGIPWETESVR